VYVAGPKKKHGCLIGFRKDELEIHDQFVLHYDDVDVRTNGTARSHKASSFRTKNIANVVALQEVGHPGEGYIVATTHLFWHPSSVKSKTHLISASQTNFFFDLCSLPGTRMNELGSVRPMYFSPRTHRSAFRQAGILLREVVKYREKSGLLSWPCFLAGGKSRPPSSAPSSLTNTRTDFNFSPKEPGYALLVGDPLTPAQEELLEKSRVVHVSIDPSVPLTNHTATATNNNNNNNNEDEDEGGAGADADADPDRVITNAREATPADGLLSSRELADLFAVPSRPRSLYDEGQRLLEAISGGPVPRCGERMGLDPHRRGAYEPEWTSYTHYWQSVLGGCPTEYGFMVS